MAFMNQEQKKALTPGIKAVLKKYGVKASLAVRHHSTLIVNIRSGSIDFANERVILPRHIGQAREWSGHDGVNPYWYKEHWSGKALEFLSELLPAMNVGNHDRSDSMSDYYDVGWYTEVNIGQWDKDYELVPA